jgi:enoyl-CoA hydratase
MQAKNFLIEKKGSAVILYFNRPEALNALSAAMLDEFLIVLDHLKKEYSKNSSTLILTGAGTKSFIAGADISEMAKMNSADALFFARLGQRVTKEIEKFPLPVISAVNGFALGGGCEIAISADFIFCSENAVFAQPEVSLGLITGFGGAVRLSKFVGLPVAKELLYSGRRVSSQEAKEIGLVNKVFPSEKLMEEVLKISDLISKNSSSAVKNIKETIHNVNEELKAESRLEVEAKAFSKAFETFDQKEGTAAFLEKRKPVFRGE